MKAVPAMFTLLLGLRQMGRQQSLMAQGRFMWSASRRYLRKRCVWSDVRPRGNDSASNPSINQHGGLTEGCFRRPLALLALRDLHESKT